MKYENRYFNEILYINIQKPALYLAVEKENIEIIKLLVSNSKTDVDKPFISNNIII